MESALELSLRSWSDRLSDDQQVKWQQTIRSLLIECRSAPSSCRIEGTDSGWVLLGWCENATSEAVRHCDFDLLEIVSFGLSLVSRSPLDEREVWLVGALVRRSVSLIGRNWPSLLRRFKDDQDVTALLQRFPHSVSPVSHREIGIGEEFRFERVPLAEWSPEELLRRMKGE